jgi:hypothetical protein
LCIPNQHQLLLLLLQVGLACYVRACLVVVTSLFHLTYNLPPLDVAPQLWGPVAVMLG